MENAESLQIQETNCDEKLDVSLTDKKLLLQTKKRKFPQVLLQKLPIKRSKTLLTNDENFSNELVGFDSLDVQKSLESVKEIQLVYGIIRTSLDKVDLTDVFKLYEKLKENTPIITDKPNEVIQIADEIDDVTEVTEKLHEEVSQVTEKIQEIQEQNTTNELANNPETSAEIIDEKDDDNSVEFISTEPFIEKNLESIPSIPEHSSDIQASEISKTKAESVVKRNRVKRLKGEKRPKRRKSSYAQYLGLQPTLKFKCDKCTVTFPTLESLNEHLYVCKAERNNSVIDLTEIQKKCSNNSTNIEVSTNIDPSGAKSNQTNFKITRKVYLCSACGTYYEIWNLFLHMRQKHHKHICLLCLGLFPTADQLSSHLSLKHDLSIKKYDDIENIFADFGNQVILCCCSCERLFDESENFEAHVCGENKDSDKLLATVVSPSLAPNKVCSVIQNTYLSKIGSGEIINLNKKRWPDNDSSDEFKIATMTNSDNLGASCSSKKANEVIPNYAVDGIHGERSTNKKSDEIKTVDLTGDTSFDKKFYQNKSIDDTISGRNKKQKHSKHTDSKNKSKSNVNRPRVHVTGDFHSNTNFKAKDEGIKSPSNYDLNLQTNLECVNSIDKDANAYLQAEKNCDNENRLAYENSSQANGKQTLEMFIENFEKESKIESAKLLSSHNDNSFNTLFGNDDKLIDKHKMDLDSFLNDWKKDLAKKEISSIFDNSITNYSSVNLKDNQMHDDESVKINCDINNKNLNNLTSLTSYPKINKTDGDIKLNVLQNHESSVDNSSTNNYSLNPSVASEVKNPELINENKSENDSSDEHSEDEKGLVIMEKEDEEEKPSSLESKYKILSNLLNNNDAKKASSSENRSIFDYKQFSNAFNSNETEPISSQNEPINLLNSPTNNENINTERETLLAENQTNENEVEKRVPKVTLKIPRISEISRIEEDSLDTDSDDSMKLTMEVDADKQPPVFNTLNTTDQTPINDNADVAKPAENQVETVENTQVNGETIEDPENEIPIIDLGPRPPLEHELIQRLLKDFVRITCYLCIYCNHARKIAVNGKQLGLHMIAEHRFSAIADSITAEELLPETFIQFIKDNLESLNDMYFNLDTYDSTDPEIVVPFDRIFECFQCRFLTTTHKELCGHNRRFHAKPILLCIMCKSNFFSYSELLCHLCPGEYVEGIVDLNFRCCICALGNIPSAFRLMVHVRKQHHMCDVCLEMCGTQLKLSGHVWKHKLLHLCYRCNIAYRNKEDITKHLFWKHGTESVQCKKCLQKKWPHVYHFCTPPNLFTCDVCSINFSRPVALKVHKRLHTGNIPYACTEDNCNDKFVSRKLLSKHLQAHREPPVIKPPVFEQQIILDNSVTAGGENIDVVGDKVSENIDGVKANESEEKNKDEKNPSKIIDVYEAIPALNLSESDSSDSEDESKKEKVNDNAADVEKTEAVKEPIVNKQENIWDSFRSYPDPNIDEKTATDGVESKTEPKIEPIGSHIGATDDSNVIDMEIEENCNEPVVDTERVDKESVDISSSIPVKEEEENRSSPILEKEPDEITPPLSEKLLQETEVSNDVSPVNKIDETAADTINPIPQEETETVPIASPKDGLILEYNSNESELTEAEKDGDQNTCDIIEPEKNCNENLSEELLICEEKSHATDELPTNYEKLENMEASMPEQTVDSEVPINDINIEEINLDTNEQSETNNKLEVTETLNSEFVETNNKMEAIETPEGENMETNNKLEITETPESEKMELLDNVEQVAPPNIKPEGTSSEENKVLDELADIETITHDHDYISRHLDQNDANAIPAQPGPPAVPPTSDLTIANVSKLEKTKSSKKKDNSSSDSDSSSCTCGTNCSCSASSSSDSDSSSSSSSSGSARSNKSKKIRTPSKQKAEVEKRKKKVSETVDVVTEEPIPTILQPEPPPLIIYESDLDTDESDTDAEDFYDQYPQKLAQKMQEEKKNQFLLELESQSLNGTLPYFQDGASSVASGGSPTVTPVPSAVVEDPKKSKSRSRKRKKGARLSRKTTTGARSRKRPELKIDNLNLNLTPAPLAISQPKPQITPVSTPKLPKPNESSALFDSSDVRVSKRRRVPNKFYGYTNNEEEPSMPRSGGSTPRSVSQQRLLNSMLVRPMEPPQLNWNEDDLPAPRKSTTPSPVYTPSSLSSGNDAYSSNSPYPPLFSTSPYSNNAPIQPNYPPSVSDLSHGYPNYSQRYSAPFQNKASPSPIWSKVLQDTQNASASESDTGADSDDNKLQINPVEFAKSTTASSKKRNTAGSAKKPRTPKTPGGGQRRGSNKFSTPSLLQYSLTAPQRPSLALPGTSNGSTLSQLLQKNVPSTAAPAYDHVRTQPVSSNLLPTSLTISQAIPDSNVYCYCQCPYDEVSEMIACDAKNCKIEWFHFECVGIMVPPKGKWYCPDCRKKSSSSRPEYFNT